MTLDKIIEKQVKDFEIWSLAKVFGFGGIGSNFWIKIRKNDFWSWIVSKFQSHDRKMLEWCLNLVEEKKIKLMNKSFYGTEKDVDEILLVEITHNKVLEELRQLINQKIKNLREEK